MFGASDRNAEKRTAEYGDWYDYLEQYEEEEEIRKEAYTASKKKRDADIKYNEDNIRFREKEVIRNYEQAVEMRDFDYNNQRRAYDKSVEIAETQKSFNAIADAAATREQNTKRKDDMLSVLFDAKDTILEHAYATTGLKVDKNNKLVEANFQQAKVNAAYNSDMSEFGLERRKARSESQVETQKAILEGMKAAGQIRSRGNAGRSANKSALAVMAESGALRASIANGLMYAEDGIDLNIAQLKDMMILDQTMVLAAKDAAENEYDMKSTKLDSSLALDRIKIRATRESIRTRDKQVREQIANARIQADMQAEAQIMLEPQRLPPITNPSEFYKEYDNPDTEDYLEMFIRPDIQPFPDYEAAPQMDFEKDFHYSRGREDVASSNFGDALKLGGMIAGGIGSLGATGALAGLGIAGAGTTGATLAATYAQIGTGLTTLSSSFYPKQGR